MNEKKEKNIAGHEQSEKFHDKESSNADDYGIENCYGHSVLVNW